MAEHPLENLLDLFKYISPEAANEIRHRSRVHTFQAGETIYLQGAPPAAIYLLARGKVKLVRVTKTGDEVVLCVRREGEYFCPIPVIDKGPQLGTALAITDVTLLVIDIGDFHILCQKYPELLLTVQRSCLMETRLLLKRVEMVTFRTVRERIATILLDEMRRLEATGRPPETIHLTHFEVAGLIGASRESVSRALKQLEKQNVLRLGRGKIIVLEREKLRQIADE